MKPHRLIIALLVLAACGAPRSARPGGVSATPSTAASGAYPYTTPTPPAEPSAIDGQYVRIVGEDLAGGAGKCRRCPPYRLEVAASTLTLKDGVFLIENEVISPKAIDWKSVGHFTVTGDHVTLFNDPNCPTTRGTYRWTVSHDVLTLDVIEDDCAFGGLRWHYLERLPWTRTTSQGDAGSRSA